MKYIIKESQIKNLMWEYFDSYDYNVLEDEFEVFLENKNGGYDWGYTFDDGRLLVSNEIIIGFAAMFNVSDEAALEYAGEWFENNYGYTVEEIVNWDL